MRISDHVGEILVLFARLFDMNTVLKYSSEAIGFFSRKNLCETILCATGIRFWECDLCISCQVGDVVFSVGTFVKSFASELRNVQVSVSSHFACMKS